MTVYINGVGSTGGATAVQVRTEMDANSTKLTDILTDTGTTLNTHLTDIKGATFVGADDSLEAVRNRGDSAWITGGGTGLSALATGTAQDGTGGNIKLAAGASASTNLYRGARILITGGTGDEQSRIITHYDGGTKIATITPVWVTTPDGTSTYEIQAADSNVEAIHSDAQSMVDLKDFADAGYDPATNKVQGVVLADTVTALTGHTAQTGDSFARLGAPAAASVSADLLAIDNFVDELESRLTAARAGYLNNLSAGAVALASVCTNTRLAHLTQDVTVGVKKGVEYTIVFKMVDATDFATPEPSITVTEERSLDGGAFAACTNAASEIGGAGNGSGWYKITLSSTEMNANEIIFKGTGAGCAQCDRLIITES